MRFFLAAGLVALFVTVGRLPASALGRKDRQTTPTYTDEGRNPIPFNVTCNSTGWTVVLSSDAIRRSILVQAEPGNTVTVCISTTTNSADNCNANANGVHLTAGQSLTDYTTVQWTCRAFSSNAVVTGYATRDKGDYGDISNPANQ